MDRLWQDIRYGARLLIRFPGVTAAALVALALGTGVNTALFSVVNTVLLQPLPFPDSHELVQLWRTEPPTLQLGAASYPRYVDWRARNRVFEEMGAWTPAGFALIGREVPERVAGARATASFFRTIGASPVIGRWFTDEEDRPGTARTVVLSEPFWRRRFGGSPAALGTSITLEGQPHTIVGIAPASMYESWRFDAWVPLALAVDQTRRAGPNFLQSFGRLGDGVTLDQARAGLTELAHELGREHQVDRYGFNVLSLHEVQTGGPRQALWILLGTTGFVLLIGCVNVANLLLARAVTRQKEMAVRTALGAGRTRLLRQLLTETLLLALLGSALGLLLAQGLLQLFVAMAPPNFPRLASISLDRTVLLFSTGVALLCGIVASVLPAMHVAHAQPSDALREGSSRGATAGRAHAASGLLVMSEVALAVMLVAAAGLTVKSLQRLMQQDLGLVTQNILTFNIGLSRPGAAANTPVTLQETRLFTDFEERIRALPGVTSVGAISLLPIAQTGTNGQVNLRDRVLKREEAPIAEFRVVTPSYFETVGMRLVAGRFPDTRDTASTPDVVVINESLARQLWEGKPAADILGQMMGTGFDDRSTFREVIGITRDVRSRRVDQPADAETYVPIAQVPWGSMTYTVRAATRAESLVPLIRDALADLNPDLPLASVRMFEEIRDGAMRTSRLYSALTALFGLLAAALAIVGIYSVMSYTVAQRTRELAIRAALGASHQGLLSMVLREGFLMTGIGIAAGVVGAIATSRLLQALLYQVSPTDPIVLASTALGVAFAALFGYMLPAMRASRVEPAVALRAE